MKNILTKIRNISRVQLIALALILIGLAIMVYRGLGMFEFYKEVRYATENNFRAGNISPDLLRPWMTIRYIGVSFAVPQKYLFDTTGIRPSKENSMIALNRLNSQMSLGQESGKPVLINRVKDAIVAYRANPVVTGLIEGKVTDWMSIQYIANSTGIPAEKIFEKIGIPMDGNAYVPIGYLADSTKYNSGPKALVAAIQSVVDEMAPQPVYP